MTFIHYCEAEYRTACCVGSKLKEVADALAIPIRGASSRGITESQSH